MHIYIDDNSNPLKEFQLPPDFNPELSRTNPFLSDEGSQSVPLTLPASEHNMRIVGYSHRAVPTNRPVSRIPVIISDESVWIRGTILISQTNKKDGVKCTFYTNEGQLYDKIKDYKLKDLNWPKKTGNGSDMTTRAKDLMLLFEDIMNHPEYYPSPDYYIFSLTTNFTFLPEEYKNTQHLDFYNLVLNEFRGDPPKLAAYTKRTYLTETGDDAKIYEVPVAYGVTPFLRIGYILRHLFEYFGYTLNTNLFDTNESMKRLCLLNNTADAIVSGELDYSQLMPQSLTVEDFINTIREKFSVEFIERNGVITMKTWDEILSQYPDMDLSRYIRNNWSWGVTESRSIQIDYEATCQIDFPNVLKAMTHSPISGMEIEDLSTNDKMPFYQDAYYDAGGLTGNIISALYIGDISHLNSEIIYSDGTEPENETISDIGIMICFSDPTSFPILMNNRYFNGTIYPPITNSSTKFSLLAGMYSDIPGIYERFYQSRDAMLQKANQQVIYEANIPVYAINSMDISSPKIINGQKVLIERIDYVIGRTDLCQITARTLHLMDEH